MDKISKFLEIEIFHVGEYVVNVNLVAFILLIMFITKLLLWAINKGLHRRQETYQLDRGNTYAVYKIIKYIIWTISIALMLESLGIKLTVLIAGSAALLVGIGLGLQHTFNDIVSGLILLSERSIKVDDVLEIDDDVVRIQSIGLRTSMGLNRDDISIILPNSLITTNKVINWSHQSRSTRFEIKVGVAYGSDVDLVLKVLKEAAEEHQDVSKKKPVSVQFTEFNNSSLDFRLLFFSDDVFRIERVKSEIRKTINQKFIENGIKIPFPQMDLHVIRK